MIGHSTSLVERYCRLTGIKQENLRTVKTPSVDDHEISPSDLENTGSLAVEAHSLVATALYTARIARPDTYYAVNVLAREITKWNRACDKRLHRLMCYIHHTSHLC